MKSTWIAIGAYLCVLAALAAPAEAAVLDLNDFFAHPTVDVSADGTVAVIHEDPIFALVVLSLDPGLGDPNLIIPQPGFELLFDYNINIPPSDGGAVNNDMFTAFLLDAATGLSLGAPFEFVTNSSATGQISFDLTALTGSIIGLQFQLEALSGDLGLNSTATISNVRVEESTEMPGTVPEPGAALLLLTGLVVADWKRRSHS